MQFRTDLAMEAEEKSTGTTIPIRKRRQKRNEYGR